MGDERKLGKEVKQLAVLLVCNRAGHSSTFMAKSLHFCWLG